jgi:hypothetical protein
MDLYQKERWVNMKQEQQWETNQAWIAHFDILGFKSMIEHEDQSLALELLKSKLDDVIVKLKREIESKAEHIDFQFYADTFIIYSKSENIHDYSLLIRACKNFTNNCIYKRLPVRGAISYGEMIFGHNRKIIIGSAFLESYVYGEDQNWIGLILTPSASSRVIEDNSSPARHGFINRDIPMRKFSIFEDKIYAYTFIKGMNGSTNLKCPLLPILNEMLQKAPQREKVKFVNTISS